jgi:predicted AAA+ superfamily ATPase
MKEGSKGRDYETALEWLKNSGLVYQLKRVSLPNIPLASYQEPHIFKLYCPDIGLLSAQTALDLKTYIEGDDKIFNHYKGALTEQFVLQELRAACPWTKAAMRIPLYYWAAEKNTAEIDFVVQFEDMVIPIEVKAGESVRAKSLKTYMDTFKPPLAVLASLREYSVKEIQPGAGKLYDIPLYMIGEFPALIGG